MNEKVTMKLKLGSHFDLVLIITSFFTLIYAISFKTAGRDPLNVLKIEHVNYFFIIALILFISDLVNPPKNSPIYWTFSKEYFPPQ